MEIRVRKLINYDYITIKYSLFQARIWSRW